MRTSLPRGWVICRAFVSKVLSIIVSRTPASCAGSNLSRWQATLIACTLIFNTPTQSQTEEQEILDFLPAIMSGFKKLPRPLDFSVARPSIPTGTTYEIELSRWDIPSNGSQPIKTTDQLQAAINWASEQGANKIVIPNGHFLIGKYGNAIYQAGISLPSNIELILSSNTLLEMATNDKWNYCVISVTGKSNVIIRGGTIKGDRDTHVFTPRASDGATAHDEGHAICLQSGTNKVLVEGTRIHSVTGDGLLLVTDITDVTIRENEIFNNRRQGVSIVGGQRIAITNNEIHHIRGTSPQFGVDIEGAGRLDRDILIKRNRFHHNRGGDIVNTSGKNVFILENTLHQGTAGFDNRYIDGPLVTWERTDNVIAHNTITMLDRSVNGLLGFIQYSGNRDNNPSITYVHDNVCNGCGMYVYDAGDVDIQRNQLRGYFLALANVQNATVNNNHVTYGPPGTPRYCWNYRIRESTGVARGNTLEGQPFDLPLSTTPWTSECLRR